jgi:hypothetical protein
LLETQVTGNCDLGILKIKNDMGGAKIAVLSDTQIPDSMETAPYLIPESQIA